MGLHSREAFQQRKTKQNKTWVKPSSHIPQTAYIPAGEEELLKVKK